MPSVPSRRLSARDVAARMRGLPLGALWPMIGRVHFDTRAKVAALDARNKLLAVERLAQ